MVAPLRLVKLPPLLLLRSLLTTLCRHLPQSPIPVRLFGLAARGACALQSARALLFAPVGLPRAASRRGQLARLRWRPLLGAGSLRLCSTALRRRSRHLQFDRGCRRSRSTQLWRNSDKRDSSVGARGQVRARTRLGPAAAAEVATAAAKPRRESVQTKTAVESERQQASKTFNSLPIRLLSHFQLGNSQWQRPGEGGASKCGTSEPEFKHHSFDERKSGSLILAKRTRR